MFNISYNPISKAFYNSKSIWFCDPMIKKIDNPNYEVIETFIKRYNKKGTFFTYRSILKHYFKTLEIKNPDTYFNKKRDYKKDVEAYAESMQGDEVPAKTFTVRLATVKKFLQRHDIEFKQNIWEDLKSPKTGYRQAAYPVIDDRIPTREEIKTILSHGGILEKSFFTVLLSSGMRIGELCKIKITDVDFRFSPVKIELQAKYTKNRRKRTVFISDEAGSFTQEWLKVRDEWLKQAVLKVNIVKDGVRRTKSETDDKLFPFYPNCARQKWERMLRDATTTTNNLNEKDVTIRNHLRLHPHCLRKFFRIRVPDKIGVDLTEGLMGHGSGLTMVYRKYGEDKKKIGKEYLKGMSEVTIFESTPDLSGINEELKALKDDMEKKDKQINEMGNQILLLLSKKETQRK